MGKKDSKSKQHYHTYSDVNHKKEDFHLFLYMELQYAFFLSFFRVFVWKMVTCITKIKERLVNDCEKYLTINVTQNKAYAIFFF